MKRIDRLKKEAVITLEKIRVLARHIRNVEDNCVFLAEKLLLRGELDLARNLVANGMVHDASKFFGIEFDYLSIGNPNEEYAKLKLKLAVEHHQKTNRHHPEHWGNIRLMPKVYLGEMVADWKSRSEEFGTDLRNWINEDATKRWEFMTDERVYKEIMEFVDMLCPVPFENLSK